MAKNFGYVPLGPALLAGVFTGIVTALVVLVVNVVYRSEVNLSSYMIVMPLSIFLAFPLMNLIAGGIYFLFVNHLRRGQAVYKTVVVLVSVMLMLVTAFVGTSSDRSTDKFRGLLALLELVEGLMAAVLLPFFAHHPRLFLTDKDAREEA